MDVIDPVIVAALVSGNDIVILIGSRGQQPAEERPAMSGQQQGKTPVHETKMSEPWSSTGSEHAHGVVPAHERGHDQGLAHVNVHDHVNVDDACPAGPGLT
ncbi:MAG TPA: hypothetical protein VJV78_22195 [Polyangiales bacterium]|nr:hypothetical protein [Polyangiales bacterium]